MKVEKGDTVKVDYIGSFDNGKVFDDSARHGAPLEFKVGAQQVVKGFDEAVLGMEKGEEKEVDIGAVDAYGAVNEQLHKKVPKEHLPQDKEAKEGMTLLVTLPTGQKIPAKIMKVEEKEVTIDLNHPLAGKDLHFKIKVIEVSKEAEAPAEASEAKKEE